MEKKTHIIVSVVVSVVLFATVLVVALVTNNNTQSSFNSKQEEQTSEFNAGLGELKEQLAELRTQIEDAQSKNQAELVKQLQDLASKLEAGDKELAEVDGAKVSALKDWEEAFESFGTYTVEEEPFNYMEDAYLLGYDEVDEEEALAGLNQVDEDAQKAILSAQTVKGVEEALAQAKKNAEAYVEPFKCYVECIRAEEDFAEYQAENLEYITGCHYWIDEDGQTIDTLTERNEKKQEVLNIELDLTNVKKTEDIAPILAEAKAKVDVIAFYPHIRDYANNNETDLADEYVEDVESIVAGAKHEDGVETVTAKIDAVVALSNARPNFEAVNGLYVDLFNKLFEFGINGTEYDDERLTVFEPAEICDVYTDEAEEEHYFVYWDGGYAEYAFNGDGDWAFVAEVPSLEDYTFVSQGVYHDLVEKYESYEYGRYVEGETTVDSVQAKVIADTAEFTKYCNEKLASYVHDFIDGYSVVIASELVNGKDLLVDQLDRDDCLLTTEEKVGFTKLLDNVSFAGVKLGSKDLVKALDEAISTYYTDMTLDEIVDDVLCSAIDVVNVCALAKAQDGKRFLLRQDEDENYREISALTFDEYPESIYAFDVDPTKPLHDVYHGEDEEFADLRANLREALKKVDEDTNKLYATIINKLDYSPKAENLFDVTDLKAYVSNLKIVSLAQDLLSLYFTDPEDLDYENILTESGLQDIIDEITELYNAYTDSYDKVISEAEDMVFDQLNEKFLIEDMYAVAYDFHQQGIDLYEAIYGGSFNYGEDEEGNPVPHEYFKNLTGEIKYSDFAQPVQNIKASLLHTVETIYTTLDDADDYFATCDNKTQCIAKAKELVNELKAVEEKAQSWSLALETLKKSCDTIEGLDVVGKYSNHYELNTLKQFIRDTLPEHFVSKQVTPKEGDPYWTTEFKTTEVEFTTKLTAKVTELSELLEAKKDYVDEYDFLVGDAVTVTAPEVDKYGNFSYATYCALANSDFEGITGTVLPYQYLVKNVDDDYPTLQNPEFLYPNAKAAVCEEDDPATTNKDERGVCYKLFESFKVKYNHDAQAARFAKCDTVEKVEALGADMRNDYANIVGEFNKAYANDDLTYKTNYVASLTATLQIIEDYASSIYGAEYTANKSKINALTHETITKLDACAYSYEAYVVFVRYLDVVTNTHDGYAPDNQLQDWLATFVQLN